jgi:nucleotide-binding universal stress UspA family protein
MNSLIRNILVYIDGSESSITAAQYAICLAKTVSAKLFALYVVNTRALTDLVAARIFLKEEQDEFQVDLHQDAERYLNHVKNLGLKKGLEVQTLSLSGTVNQEIKNALAAHDIDLFVLGETAQVRSRRDEFYSEAERAMRGSTCSVLVVKDEERVWNVFDSFV